MGSTNAVGRKIKVARPASLLFSVFSDLTNFTRSMPADALEKAKVVSTPDTIKGKVQGMDMGIKIAERIPFSLIRYDQLGTSPIPFRIYVRMESITESESTFQIEIEAELSGMFKMMLGGKMQEGVDKLTDELEKAMGGVSA